MDGALSSSAACMATCAQARETVLETELSVAKTRAYDAEEARKEAEARAKQLEQTLSRLVAHGLPDAQEVTVLEASAAITAPGLEALMKAADCTDVLLPAERWCRDNGVTNTSQLAAMSAQLRDGFVTSLSLTPVRRDRIVLELDRRAVPRKTQCARAHVRRMACRERRRDTFPHARFRPRAG